MNCRQGDLAIVVRSDAGNEGKVVRCVRLLPPRSWVTPAGDVREAWTWAIDTPLVGWGGKVSRLIADDQLRPIRDNDNPDEVLTRIGKPEGITA